MAILKVVPADNAEEWEFLLEQDQVTIGRGDDNGLALDDKAASRHHAEITKTATGFLIRDLGSSNGTWVNRERIEAHDLGDGDEVRIGGTTLIFSDPEFDESTILVDLAGIQDAEATHAQSPPLPPVAPQPQAPAPPVSPPPMPVASAPVPPVAPPPPPVVAAPPEIRASSARGAAGSGAQAGETAGFGIRLGAYLIDSIILTIAVMAIMVPSGILAAVIGPKSQGFALFVSLVGWLLGMAVGIGYLLVPWAKSGITPGKKMLKLKIVREDGVEPLGYAKAGLRLLGYMASGFIFYIGFIMVAFTDGHKGLHDMIAGTRVVKT